MNETKTTIHISTGTLIRIVVFVACVFLLWQIRDVLLILLVAVLIASGLEPIVSYLQKFRIPRAVSLIVTYIILIALIGGIGTLLIPPLVFEIQNLTENLPQIYQQLVMYWGSYLGLLGTGEIFSSLQKSLGDVGQFLGQISGGFFATTKSFFGGMFAVVLTFVISFYLVLSKDSLTFFVKSVVPLAHQNYILILIKKCQYKIGRWLIAQCFLGLIVGIFVFIGLWVLNVPYALALALLAAVLELVPVIGPIIAAIPAALLGFTNSFLVGILVIVLFIVVNQLENHVLVPNIMKRAIGLNPLTTIIAIIIGGKLAGFVGILLAVPVATIVSVIFNDLLAPNKGREELPG